MDVYRIHPIVVETRAATASEGLTANIERSISSATIEIEREKQVITGRKQPVLRQH